MASNFYKAGAAAMTSNKDDWETPQSLFDQLDEEFHFILDAASSDQNAKCEHHYTAENSGLEHSWKGRRFSAILPTAATSVIGYAKPHRKPANLTLS